MKDILNWIGTHIWDIIGGGFVIAFGGRLFDMLVKQPLQGDDGEVSMNELAKYSLIVYLGIELFVPTNRNPDIVLPLILGVAAIAGIQIYMDKNEKDKKTP